MRLGKDTRQIVTQAAIAAAFAAGFNSDWGKEQFARLRQDLEGNLRPYVPWALAAGLVYFFAKGGR